MDCGLDIPKIILNDLNQKFLNGGGEFIKNTLFVFVKFKNI